jgi:hypothetical protein
LPPVPMPCPVFLKNPDSRISHILILRVCYQRG